MPKQRTSFIYLLLLILTACGTASVEQIPLTPIQDQQLIYPIYQAAWLNDTQIVFGSGPEILVWDTIQHTATQRLNHGSRSIIDLDYNASTQRISALTDNAELYVWQLGNSTPVYTNDELKPQRFSYPVHSIASTSEGTTIVGSPYIYALPEEMSSYVWDIPTRTMTQEPQGSWATVIPDTFSTLLEVNLLSGTLQAIDQGTLTLKWIYEAKELEFERILAVDQTSNLLCATSICHVIENQSGNLEHIIDVHQGFVTQAYLLEHRIVLIHSLETSLSLNIDVYERKTGDMLRTIQIDQPTTQNQPFGLKLHASLSPQGMLAMAFGAGSDSYDFVIEDYKDFSPVYLYDIATGTQLATLDSHTDAVNVLAFNPSGTILFTGSSDKTFKLWQLNK